MESAVNEERVFIKFGLVELLSKKVFLSVLLSPFKFMHLKDIGEANTCSSLCERIKFKL